MIDDTVARRIFDLEPDFSWELISLKLKCYWDSCAETPGSTIVVAVCPAQPTYATSGKIEIEKAKLSPAVTIVSCSCTILGEPTIRCANVTDLDIECANFGVVGDIL